MRVPTNERLAILYAFVSVGMAVEALVKSGSSDGMALLRGLASSPNSAHSPTTHDTLDDLAAAVEMSGDFSLDTAPADET